MTKLSTLSLSFLILVGSSEATSQASVEPEKLQWASGFLDAHWEYPNFLPDKDSGLKIMPFQIREDKWQRIYADPVNYAYIHHPDKTICFRVIGQGLVAPRKSTFKQPWEGSQFIFRKIKKLERLSSDQECASRMKRDGG